MALNLLDLPSAENNDEDDEGEFCPCAFSDDEEEEHGIDCLCPLCKHGDGGTEMLMRLYLGWKKLILN